MKKYLIFLVFSACCLVASSVWAQDSGEAEVGESTAQATESEADAVPQVDVEAAHDLASAESVTPEQLNRQLREVGTRVDTLKEDTFSTKSRLLLLREEVLRRSVSGSRLILVHKNTMKWPYKMVQMSYAVDRESKFSRVDPSGALDDIKNEVIYDAMMAPGSHFLTVQYVYRGNMLGVFRYMNEYSFKVEAGYAFVLEEGKATELTVAAKEAGNFFTAYEDRPSISFTTQSYDIGLEDSDSKSKSDGKRKKAKKK
ncbi:MAG: hypothetical protein WC966_04935 [Bradymonadales bacterium]|jgi:hypothetical protein